MKIKTKYLQKRFQNANKNTRNENEYRLEYRFKKRFFWQDLSEFHFDTL